MRATSFSILSAIMLLAGQAVAFNPYVGCLDPDSVAGNGYYVSPLLDNGEQCASECAGRNSPQMLYSYSAYYGDSQVCQCLIMGSGDLPVSTSWRPSIDTAGTCAPETATVHRLNTAWQSSNEKCSTGFTPVTPVTRFRNYPTLSECFTYCQRSTTADTYQYMVFIPRDTGVFSCQCASGIISQGASTCDQRSFFAFQRTAVAAASGAYRRSLKETAKRQLSSRKKHVYCPASLQACNIPGSPDAYECMDTKYELESCGGCIAGEFGVASSNSTSTAVDCSRIPGVPMGATSCLAGKCVAFACQSGYALRDGVCSRS